MKNHTRQRNGMRACGIICMLVWLVLTGGCGPSQRTRKSGSTPTASEAVDIAVFTLQQREIYNFKHTGTQRRDPQFMVALTLADTQRKAMVFLSPNAAILQRTGDEEILPAPSGPLPPQSLENARQAADYVLKNLVSKVLQGAVQVEQTFYYKPGWFVFFKYYQGTLVRDITLFVDDNRTAVFLPD